MKHLTGNLLDLAEAGRFDVIVHGCNCFHAMGGGIAREIALRYPQVEQADFETPRGSKGKLGSYSSASVSRSDGSQFVVINGYTQYRWSGNTDVFEYLKFETLLNRLTSFLHGLHLAKGERLSVGFPKIGCGLAGGDESRIIPMIDKFSSDVSPWADVYLVTLT